MCTGHWKRHQIRLVHSVRDEIATIPAYPQIASADLLFCSWLRPTVCIPLHVHCPLHSMCTDTAAQIGGLRTPLSIISVDDIAIQVQYGDLRWNPSCGVNANCPEGLHFFEGRLGWAFLMETSCCRTSRHSFTGRPCTSAMASGTAEAANRGCGFCAHPSQREDRTMPSQNRRQDNFCDRIRSLSGM